MLTPRCLNGCKCLAILSVTNRVRIRIFYQNSMLATTRNTGKLGMGSLAPCAHGVRGVHAYSLAAPWSRQSSRGNGWRFGGPMDVKVEKRERFNLALITDIVAAFLNVQDLARLLQEAQPLR